MEGSWARIFIKEEEYFEKYSNIIEERDGIRNYILPSLSHLTKTWLNDTEVTGGRVLNAGILADHGVTVSYGNEAATETMEDAHQDEDWGELIRLYPYITKLNLRMKGLCGIAHTNWMENLVELDLSFNRIGTLRGLGSLVVLEVVNVSYNKIEQIDGLENLPNLKSLNLRQNRIKNIEGFDKSTRLEQLNVSSNRIHSFTSIGYLNMFKDLKLLNLENNPVCLKDGDKFVNAAVPQVQVYNYLPVTDRQRRKAIEMYKDKVDRLIMYFKAKAFKRQFPHTNWKETLPRQFMKRWVKTPQVFVEKLKGNYLFVAQFEEDADSQEILKLTKIPTPLGKSVKELYGDFKQEFTTEAKKLYEHGQEQYLVRKKETVQFISLYVGLKRKVETQFKVTINEWGKNKTQLIKKIAELGHKINEMKKEKEHAEETENSGGGLFSDEDYESSLIVDKKIVEIIDMLYGFKKRIMCASSKQIFNDKVGSEPSYALFNENDERSFRSEPSYKIFNEYYGPLDEAFDENDRSSHKLLSKYVEGRQSLDQVFHKFRRAPSDKMFIENEERSEPSYNLLNECYGSSNQLFNENYGSTVKVLRKYTIGTEASDHESNENYEPSYELLNEFENAPSHEIFEGSDPSYKMFGSDKLSEIVTEYDAVEPPNELFNQYDYFRKKAIFDRNEEWESAESKCHSIDKIITTLSSVKKGREDYGTLKMFKELKYEIQTLKDSMCPKEETELHQDETDQEKVVGQEIATDQENDTEQENMTNQEKETHQRSMTMLEEVIKEGNKSTLDCFLKDACNLPRGQARREFFGRDKKVAEKMCRTGLPSCEYIDQTCGFSRQEIARNKVIPIIRDVSEIEILNKEERKDFMIWKEEFHKIFNKTKVISDGIVVVSKVSDENIDYDIQSGDESESKVQTVPRELEFDEVFKRFTRESKDEKKYKEGLKMIKLSGDIIISDTKMDSDSFENKQENDELDYYDDEMYEDDEMNEDTYEYYDAMYDEEICEGEICDAYEEDCVSLDVNDLNELHDTFRPNFTKEYISKHMNYFKRLCLRRIKIEDEVKEEEEIINESDLNLLCSVFDMFTRQHILNHIETFRPYIAEERAWLKEQALLDSTLTLKEELVEEAAYEELEEEWEAGEEEKKQSILMFVEPKDSLQCKIDLINNEVGQFLHQLDEVDESIHYQEYRLHAHLRRFFRTFEFTMEVLVLDFWVAICQSFDTLRKYATDFNRALGAILRKFFKLVETGKPTNSILKAYKKHPALCKILSDEETLEDALNNSYGESMDVLWEQQDETVDTLNKYFQDMIEKIEVDRTDRHKMLFMKVDHRFKIFRDDVESALHQLNMEHARLHDHPDGSQTSALDPVVSRHV